VSLSAVTLTIQLADGARAASDAAVVVTARARGAVNTVLAERRISGSELPVTIVFDDSFAINPAETLSAYPQVSVHARVVSISAEGDLTGRTDVTGSENRRASLVIATPLQ
jgi:cytochrome c-type biogenesis protein CcmH